MCYAQQPQGNIGKMSSLYNTVTTNYCKRAKSAGANNVSIIYLENLPRDHSAMCMLCVELS